MDLVWSTMQRRNIIILLCILVQNAKGASRIDPLVETNIGLIRGLQANDGEYAKFTGIPYAIVDEGNPFGPSLPHPGFEEVFEAYDDSEICPQINQLSSTATGNLNCLQLNIYVPNSASSRNLLPVLVWIHGGGFSVGDGGTSFYGPTYLVRHNVILVTLNYRLGPYGFMCLDIPKVPGNQGLKDQQLALKWVKNNIGSFGGDADKITIFGESAGGVSVDLHLYTSDDTLFNKAILQSGNVLSPWGVVDPDLEAPIKLANHLGFNSDNVEDALSFLSSADPKLIIASTSELGLKFRPCVEKDFDDVDKFIEIHPVNSKISRSDYSVLIGHNDDEGSIFKEYYSIEYLKEFLNFYLVNYFNFESDEVIQNEQLIKHFYMGDDDVNEDTLQAITDFVADIHYYYPAARSIPKYLESAKTVFQYVFSYNGGRKFANQFLTNSSRANNRATYAEELGYLFSQSDDTANPTPEDQLIIDRLTTLWTNFAKYGNPTPETSNLLPVTWTPVTDDTFYYLNIDLELSIKRRPFHSRMAFWDLFFKMNGNAQKGYQEV